MATALIASIMGGAIVAVINSVSVRWRTKKQIYYESICKERKVYRDNLREYAVKFVMLCANDYTEHKSETKEIYANRILFLLNPQDEYEQQVYQLMMGMIFDFKENDRDKFLFCIMQMLKYDWERAKKEADSKEKRDVEKSKPVLENGQLPFAPAWFISIREKSWRVSYGSNKMP